MRRFLIGLATMSVFAGCSADGSNTFDTGRNNNDGIDPGNGLGSDSPFGNGSGNGDGMNGGGLGDGFSRRPVGDDNCVAEVKRGEQLSLDIYIMFDMSCSMSCEVSLTGSGLCCPLDPNPRITPVREAVVQFLGSQQGAGVAAGLGFFGHHPLFQTSCSPADYATPAVPIGPLPGQAQAIIDSLNRQGPTGETPTGAAIRGACTYLNAHRQQNPGHLLVNLLVTDGVPEAPVTLNCNPTMEDAVAAANECLAGSNIPTYVLGVGQNLNQLQTIAQAGGTDQVYLVEGGNVAQQVLDALNSIRGSAQIPCEFQIPAPPPGDVLRFDKVNVEYRMGADEPSLIYYVDDPSQCDATRGGWYYDNPTAPTKIHLCPTTCNVVETQESGQIDVALGCDRIDIPA